jgi:uncharacterized protein (TIGR02231 family)
VSNFVGKDRIKAVASGEEFEMYLGVDQNVKVEHILKKKETISKAKSKTTKVRYTYLISVENFRRGTTELRIADRVPVSTMREVKIDKLEFVPEPSEQTDEGLLTWKLQMEHGEKREISIEYVVEYPSHLSPISLGLEEYAAPGSPDMVYSGLGWALRRPESDAEAKAPHSFAFQGAAARTGVQK